MTLLPGFPADKSDRIQKRSLSHTHTNHNNSSCLSRAPQPRSLPLPKHRDYRVGLVLESPNTEVARRDRRTGPDMTTTSHPFHPLSPLRALHLPILLVHWPYTSDTIWEANKQTHPSRPSLSLLSDFSTPVRRPPVEIPPRPTFPSVSSIGRSVFLSSFSLSNVLKTPYKK